jgi:sterol desaturase/sphingolipid hydroxylase (fatty acid hydroxylase superfamily)
MPWLMTGPTMFGLWYLCAVVLRLPLASACLAGWLAGSVWYSLVHHGLHHRDIRLSWFRTLRAHHRIHHQCPAFNFGVTMRLWDSAFGTRYRGRVFTCFTADGLFSPVANWAGQVQTPFKRNGSGGFGRPDAPRENPSRDPVPGTDAARD